MPRRKKEQVVESQEDTQAAIDLTALAKKAYEAYNAEKGYKAATPFELQMQITRSAWEAAVIGVLEVLKLWTSEPIESSPAVQDSELSESNSSESSEPDALKDELLPFSV